jgi:PAS domain S-box-containing protein
MRLHPPASPSILDARLVIESLVGIALYELAITLLFPVFLPGIDRGGEAVAHALLLLATLGPFLLWRISRRIRARQPANVDVSSANEASDPASESSDRRRALFEAAAAGGFMLVSGVLACLGLWAATRATIKDNMQEELVRLAGAAASVVDAEQHEKIVAPEMIDGPEYRRAVEPLRAMAKNIPGLRYVYTVILDGETPRFVLDAADPGDHDGDGVEDRSDILEAYQNPEPAIFVALGAGGTPGIAISTGEPYTDKWGSFVTGYAPFRDAEGRQVGVVGVDFDASTFLARLSLARNRALISTIPAILMALCAAIGVFLLRVRMLRNVRELGARELRFRSTADASPALVWSSDTTGKCDWFNRSWLEFTGRSLQQETGDGWTNGIHPEDRERCLAAYHDAFTRRTHFQNEYRLRRFDGVYRMVEDRGAPNIAPSGEFLGYVGMAIDIADRLDAEQALAAIARTNAKLAAAVDAVDDALCVTDTEGHITYVNHGFERQTGWDHDDVLGLRPSILKSGEVDAAVYRDLWTTIAQGRTWAGRIRNRRRNRRSPGDATTHGTATTQAVEASLYWVESTITPVTDADGRVTGYVSLQRDITAQVDQEEVARIAAEGAEARAAVASILSADVPLRARLEDALRRLLQMSARGPSPSAAVVAPGTKRGALAVLTQIGCGPSDFATTGERGSAQDSRHAELANLCAKAASTGEICVQVTCTNPHAAPGDEGSGPAHGHYVVPLMHAARCEGVLLLSSEPAPDCSATRLDALQQIGELLALALVKERAALLLVDAMKKADMASRSKSEFLANMSHEIRTPLTAILGYSDVLSEDREIAADPERLGQTLDTIRSAGQHLLAVVNDILDISKIEAGAMTIEEIDTNLPELLVETVALLRPRAVDRGLRLELIFDTPMPTRARTDPTRLRQVLMNLAGNALKFTQQGSVTVRAGVANPSGETVLSLSIEDTGPGLGLEEKERLFHAFSQGDTSVTRRHGGTGLGLVICQRLARLMGGNVELTRTEPGVGTVFTATFRVHLSAEVAMLDAVQPAVPSSKPALSAGLPRLAGRILLAEDGRDNQRLICLHLRKAGVEANVAENGRIALEMMSAALAEGRPYDLLLTDVQMPEMDGLTLTRTLREQGHGLPIIALTAHAMAEDRQRCLEAGCDGFATKPIDKHVLLPLCARLLETARTPRA